MIKFINLDKKNYFYPSISVIFNNLVLNVYVVKLLATVEFTVK